MTQERGLSVGRLPQGWRMPWMIWWLGGWVSMSIEVPPSLLVVLLMFHVWMFSCLYPCTPLAVKAFVTFLSL